MKELVIDIETLPVDEKDAARVEYLQQSVEADSRLKDPEKIAADIENKRAEAIGKTGLAGDFGRVLMASIGDLESGEIVTIASEPLNEAMVLQGIMKTLANFADLGSGRPTRPCLIGHNVGWDLRFIAQRCVVHGVKIDRRLLPFDAKPWDGSFVDTMTAWAGVGGKITLDRLCVALGVESPKSEMTGKDVARYYADGRFAEIVKYNRDDVLATMLVYKKMKGAALV